MQAENRPVTHEAVPPVPVRVNEPGTSMARRARDLFQYRELIGNLVRKELRVKYKNSILGFFWSLLNPAMYLLIFWIVLTKFLVNNLPAFPIYLLSGLLAWNLWSGALSSAVSSLVGNTPLVTKVYFPREVLPIASIGANLFHFFFQLIVLVVALAAFRYRLSPAGLVLVPMSLVVEVLLLVGLCMIVAVLNVYFRDVQHILELALLAWFWMTPIVYPIAKPINQLGKYWRVLLANPMTPVVLGFQRGIYARTSFVDPTNPTHAVQSILVQAPVWWYVRNLAITGLGATLLIMIGWSVFRRLESRLAEEL